MHCWTKLIRCSTFSSVPPYPVHLTIPPDPGYAAVVVLSSYRQLVGFKEELLAAMRRGHNVTARIKCITRYNSEGRSRWVHCTPLHASNGQVGVWMVVVVDDEEEQIPLNWRNKLFPKYMPYILSLFQFFFFHISHSPRVITVRYDQSFIKPNQ